MIICQNQETLMEIVERHIQTNETIGCRNILSFMLKKLELSGIQEEESDQESSSDKEEFVDYNYASNLSQMHMT